MYGKVRCARRGCTASRDRTDWTCPRCGYVKSYIDIWHAGKRYRIKDEDGNLFSNIEKAFDYLGRIRLAYNENKTSFNPVDFTQAFISERKFAWQSDLWLTQKREECEAGELSWGTYNGYKGFVAHHFTPLNDMDVRLIDYHILENFKDDLPRSLKLKSRRNVLLALHDLFKRMHRKGIIHEMPAWPVIEGDDSRVRSALTYDQQMEALAKIPEENRVPIEFGFEMGLRPGETCALKAGDFDEIHRRVLIQRTWSGSHLRETTKGKNKRWLPLSSRAWEIVAPRLRAAALDEFVFINPRSKTAYRPTILNRIWREYSGFDMDHYSASRHSFCTQLVHDGTPHLEAQALMRHADIRSTMRYFHADSERLRERIERRGRAYKMHTVSIGVKKGKND